MLLFILLLNAFLVANAVQFPTPLQTYVWQNDPAYKYELASKLVGADTTTYMLNLTSQTWLTPQDSSAYVWYHWLQVIVPNNLVESEQSGIYVDGGDQSITPPDQQDLTGIMLAVQTKTIIGHLLQVPNEPIYFTKEGHNRRTEDAIIAYTWSHFLNDTTQPEWLLRLPMVKSVVRAMDAMQDFLGKIGHTVPKKFVIAGASKRGWTTWLTPAVDERVNAIVPMVMPMLNIVNVINQMWRSLGEWSFALDDYLAMNLMADLNKPNFQVMADIIDPIVYMKYLALIPKLMIFSTGDEFFLPDSARNFYDDIQGEFHLRMVPNTEHALAPLDALVINNIAAFVQFLRAGDVRPSLTEKLEYSNTTATITVFPSEPPTYAKVWQAQTINPKRRDFRLLICGKIPDCLQPVIWLPRDLTPNSDGSYSASVDAPSVGWTGFVIELEYKTKYDNETWWQITSQVVIVPDIYPFPPCGQNYV